MALRRGRGSTGWPTVLAAWGSQLSTQLPRPARCPCRYGSSPCRQSDSLRDDHPRSTMNADYSRTVVGVTSRNVGSTVPISLTSALMTTRPLTAASDSHPTSDPPAVVVPLDESACPPAVSALSYSWQSCQLVRPRTLLPQPTTPATRSGTPSPSPPRSTPRHVPGGPPRSP